MPNWSKLQWMLMIVISIGLILNLLVSLTHINFQTTTSTSSLTTNTAIHEAMEFFQQGRQKLVKAVAPASPSSSESQIAMLSCEKYNGGPNDEFSQQEMVYWSDIASDAQYISPMRKQLGQNQRRYMTFEPDGGTYVCTLFAVSFCSFFFPLLYHLTTLLRILTRWME